MRATTFVRIECDKCSSHRDLSIGDTEALGISSGLHVLIKNRAISVGWKIFMDNAVEKTVCGKCVFHG